MTLRLCILAVLTCISSSAARAQTIVPADVIRSLREATARLDYDTAEQRAREVLESFELFSPDQLVEAHITLGIVLHTRNEPIEARQQFEAALSINPGLRLDSVLVSPKTLELFDSVVDSRFQASPVASPQTVRYVLVEDRRAAAALRSVAAPGWGQFHKGNSRRGVFFAVGTGLAALGTLSAHMGRAQARGDYLSATAPAEISRTYDRYNALNRVRKVAFVATAALWSASVLDALITGGPEPPGGGVQVTPAESGVGLSLRVGL